MNCHLLSILEIRELLSTNIKRLYTKEAADWLMPHTRNELIGKTKFWFSFYR
jgi:hypothetical protein